MSQFLAYVRPIQLQTNKYDDLMHELCTPEIPKRYTRLSELLKEGYTVTSMAPHPKLADTMMVALQGPEMHVGLMRVLQLIKGKAISAT